MSKETENDLMAEMDELDFNDAYVEEELDDEAGGEEADDVDDADGEQSLDEEESQDEETAGESQEDLQDDSGEDGESGEDEAAASSEGDSADNADQAISQESLDAVAELARLQQEKAELEAKLASVEQKDDEEPDPPAFEHTPESTEYVSEDDFYSITSDRNKFNEFLAGFEKRIVETTYNAATQNMLMNIPQVVDHQVKQQATIEKTVNDFYAVNTDLAEIKPTVAQVAQLVANENPGLGMTEVFEKTAEKVRKLLKLPPLGEAPADADTTSTESFDGPKNRGKARKKGKNKLSKLQQELDEL